MVEKEEKNISGRDATYMAVENDKRRPIALDPAPDGSVDPASESHVPVKATADSRTAPPRVLKPSRMNDQVRAPTPDLEGHRAALRRVFGTLSEDYSQTMFGKLVAALPSDPILFGLTSHRRCIRVFDLDPAILPPGPVWRSQSL